MDAGREPLLVRAACRGRPAEVGIDHRPGRGGRARRGSDGLHFVYDRVRRAATVARDGPSPPVQGYPNYPAMRDARWTLGVNRKDGGRNASSRRGEWDQCESTGPLASARGSATRRPFAVGISQPVLLRHP